VIFNSTTLDCKGKFKNFWGTTFAIRKLSDLLCAEHGLSVIENPQRSPGRNYHKWLGEDKPLSQREILRNKIDEILPNCKTFEDFLAALRATGYIVNDTRKYITVKLDGAKKAIRLKSLGEKYTEEAIKERLGLTKSVGSSGGEITKISLLIDIQNRIRESKGYAHWAKIFNLKEAAKTLIFLQENGIGTLEELTEKAASASGEFSALNGKIKDADKRLKDTNTMQKYISQYGKTRDVYAEYKASGWSRKFYAEHTADILLHRAAKKFFDNQNLEKLPKMAELKQTFAEVLAEKKSLYSDYRPLKERSHALQVALYNVKRILGVEPDEKTRVNTRENYPEK
jgi:flagellar motility protein MotE (MotC chaperone)